MLTKSKNTILHHQTQIKQFFSNLSHQELLNKIIPPLPKQQIQLQTTHLLQYIHHTYPFYLHPIPNLYFTTHPQPSIPTPITINTIYSTPPPRQSIFITYI
ncbi:arginine deiminase family protein, partial [Staphylococcus epidermidis]|uniref:arginine deiminase family protein n=1 Tax=Staphylococcus epidermidis TaxID=1282 RepID=UPI0037D9DE0C